MTGNVEGYTIRAVPTEYSKPAWLGRWRRNDWPAQEWETVVSEPGPILYASTGAALRAAKDAATAHAEKHSWKHVGIIKYGREKRHVWKLTNEQGVGYQVTHFAADTVVPPTGTGRYTAIEALLGRFGAGVKYMIDPPQAWREPTYPGDVVRIVRLARGHAEALEHGDVRIQDYMGMMRPTTGRYRVGTFLPGVLECPPGDTPKVWPERHDYARGVEQANAAFDAYYLAALAAGWWPV